MTPFETLLLVGLFTFYVSKVLLFEEKESHFGPALAFTPWLAKPRRVVWYRHDGGEGYTEYTQPVTLFDWVRRLFGVYRISATKDVYGDQDIVWYVNDVRVERWTCPTCLSFWVACPPSFIYLAIGGELAVAALLPFAAAAVSVILHRYTEPYPSIIELDGLES